MTLYALSEQQHATVLAALRYYQENGQGEPANRSDAIQDLATNGDHLVSLNEDGIDELCEELNIPDRATAAQRQAAALAYNASEGGLEIDEETPVSRGEGEAGAYVAVWCWVSDEDAENVEEWEGGGARV